ncbi:hypothetical protein [Methylobacterium fujisawaense]|uniref:hypothetical protein n=1 Tax=Methylobacterium fujisawaense TaxID=107400 RepID=UPI00313D1B36
MTENAITREGAQSGAYGIPSLPDRLSPSDQLRIFSAYYADRLPREASAELCDLADEWDEQVATALSAPSDTSESAGVAGEVAR